ncbi:MAG: hypothetical protein ACODAD_05975, partial [Planctomycetota bacterium]
PERRESRPREQGQQARLQVGTYEAEAAFQAHPAQKGMQTALQQAQTQMQQAQQQGNQEMMQQIQQQFEQAREQAIQQFEQDVSRVLPNVAEDAGVQVVAVEVAYADDDVKTVDITRGLTEALGNLGNAQQRNMPPGGTQQGRPQTPPGGAPGGTQPQR